MNDTIIQILLLVPALIVAIVFHEVAHGLMALKLGDPTAQERNRLSFNPIRHVDPIGTLLVPGGLALAGLPVFGWAKPVPVIKQRLNNPRYGMMAVAAAGPGMNFVLAAIGAIVVGLMARMVVGEPGEVLSYGFQALNYFIQINIFLALFNLLPLPPFDGSHILEGLLPDNAARMYQKLRPFGFPVLFLLLVAVPYVAPDLGIVENIVIPPVEWVIGKYYDFALLIAGQ